MFEEQYESSRFGRGARIALLMFVVPAFGYVCYGAGYNEGRVTEQDANSRTARMVSDVLDRLSQAKPEDPS